MIEITYNRGRHGVYVTGHAGFGQVGCDPVCAGVSALVLTLAGNVSELAAQGAVTEPVLHTAPGDARVSCRPAKNMHEIITMVYDTICTGFQLLQSHYPEYVRLRIRP